MCRSDVSGCPAGGYVLFYGECIRLADKGQDDWEANQYLITSLAGAKMAAAMKTEGIVDINIKMTTRSKYQSYSASSWD